MYRNYINVMFITLKEQRLPLWLHSISPAYTQYARADPSEISRGSLGPNPRTSPVVQGPPKQASHTIPTQPKPNSKT